MIPILLHQQQHRSVAPATSDHADGHCDGCSALGEECAELQSQLEALQEAVVAEGSMPLCPMCLHGMDGCQAASSYSGSSDSDG